jgi:hypothetical protein
VISSERTVRRARRLIAAAVAWGCISGMAGGADAQLIDAPWPMFQHDLQHTGRTTEFAGPSGATVDVRWKVKTTGWPKTAPAVGPEGNVYYAAGFKAICVATAGGADLGCNPKSGDANTSSPALGEPVPGSTHPYHIYRGARDNKLWSLNPNKTDNFSEKINLDGDITVSPAIAPLTSLFPGTVYYACGCLSAGLLWAIDPGAAPANRVRWSLALGESNYNSAPAIAPNGRIYIGGQGGTLFAIDDTASGPQIVWQLKAPGAKKNRNSSPSLRVDPGSGKVIIYMGSNKGLSAFQDNVTTGSHLWTKATAGDVDTTPAIGDSVIVASSFKTGKRTVYAFNFAGTQLWSRTEPSTAVSQFTQSPSAVIDKDGVIYQALGKKVFAFTAAGGLKWPTPHTLPKDAIAMALDEGVLYVGAKDSHVYALENP